MNTYFVKERLSDGRVYLCPKEPTKDEMLLQLIRAKDWGEAREQLRVDDIEAYPHRPGYGYFTNREQV